MAFEELKREAEIVIHRWTAEIDRQEILFRDASKGMPGGGWPTEAVYPGVWAYLDWRGNWLLVGYSRTNVWKAGFNPFLCKYGVCSLPIDALDEIDPIKAEIMKRAAVFRYWLCQSVRDAINMKEKLCLTHQPLLNRPPDSKARKAPWN